jgi:hypothetical protein
LALDSWLLTLGSWFLVLVPLSLVPCVFSVQLI